ncbi:hypothetical protein CK203_109029 [Vitis vinifera]|uniref:Uncharacterized protein n=1 Tax=Vitis vinifera TaxID=29760 RepID=A0A438FEK4_VITVI|nr:hypothetical protein CK203_109029 [Vitis vinifera]
MEAPYTTDIVLNDKGEVGANRVLQLHEDVLVLTLRLGRFNVRRVLVDPSSSIDLLQMSAYKQMDYSPFALESLRCLLFRFNGATMTFLGDVVLPVQVGPVTLNVQFSVVDDLSPYNAIMGRAWLHKMKEVCFSETRTSSPGPTQICRGFIRMWPLTNLTSHPPCDLSSKRGGKLLETPGAIYTKPLVGRVWKVLEMPRDVHTSLHYGGRHGRSPRLSRDF